MRVRCVPRDRGRRGVLRRIKGYVGRVPLTHHMMFGTGRTSRPALRGTPLILGLDVVPVAKCNLQFWFGKVSLSTDHIASISCDPFSSMRILFALHSHRIGTKVPLTLKRLLQLATLDGAVDLGIADPDPGPHLEVVSTIGFRGDSAIGRHKPDADRNSPDEAPSLRNGSDGSLRGPSRKFGSNCGRQEP
jgi:hypothetical protein